MYHKLIPSDLPMKHIAPLYLAIVEHENGFRVEVRSYESHMLATFRLPRKVILDLATRLLHQHMHEDTEAPKP